MRVVLNDEVGELCDILAESLTGNQQRTFETPDTGDRRIQVPVNGNALTRVDYLCDTELFE